MKVWLNITSEDGVLVERIDLTEYDLQKQSARDSLIIDIIGAADTAESEEQLIRQIPTLEAWGRLPERAYVPNTIHANGPQGEPPVLLILRGQRGYFPVYTTASADALNAALGVTPQQREAMLVGSMFGWNVPGADPGNYGPDGLTGRCGRAGCE